MTKTIGVRYIAPQIHVEVFAAEQGFSATGGFSFSGAEDDGFVDAE